MPTLSDYLFDTTNLLRDRNFLFNSQQTLTRYINQARDQVAKETGCLPVLVAGQAPFGNAAVPGSAIVGAAQLGSPALQSFSTITGVEKYAFGYAEPFLRANNSGLRAIVDVVSVSVSWGGSRPSLNWLPWEDLQAYARSYNVGTTSYPFVWSSFGSGSKGQVWLFPVPSTVTGAFAGGQGEMEWQVTALPSPIYDNDSYEALPDSVTDAVPLFAAHLAFLGSQRYGMAATMKSLYDERLLISCVAGDRGKTASFYWGDR